MITPHGGKLINKVLGPQEKQEILARVRAFKTLILNEENIKEAKNIGEGVFSPLSGFLRKQDFQRVLSDMRLSNNLVWPLPIVLDINESDYQKIKNEKTILLCDQEQRAIALLEQIEIYDYDKAQLAKKVYGSLDKNHPGVEEVYKMGKYLVGGQIKLLDTKKRLFPEYNFSPEETREMFAKRGWKTIAAFQTRNVPHRAHEFLQKYALQNVDGLFIQPVIGQKKMADFKDEFILDSYQLLIDMHYPPNKAILGILPFKMRYAGPREALFHAIVRKNFGCSHFIVGRDHAGFGKFYGPYDAQKIFDNFSQKELDINILKYKNVVWCQKCQNYVFENTCPHSPQNMVSFSGTKLRQYIQNRTEPPEHLFRSDLYQVLLQSLNPLIERADKKEAEKQKGFVLWFTGLPSSGKSTLANKVYEILKAKGIRLERLDGDIVRKSLTQDLGFSKKDRDENIKRVGFIAQLLSRNNVGVVASFISPYAQARENIRKQAENFIEVFCKCPLEVCEKRDSKGLYAKARRGEIQNFTGVSDPYQEPENPEVVVETDKETVEQSCQKIIKSLEKYVA